MMTTSTAVAGADFGRASRNSWWLAGLGVAVLVAGAAAAYEQSEWERFAQENHCKSLGRDPKALEPIGAPFLFDCGGVLYKRW